MMKRKYPLSRGLPSEPRVIKEFGVKSTKVRLDIRSGSIIGYKGDALVNACNRGGVTGFGLDGALNNAAGPELKATRKKKLGKKGIPTGVVRITDGFGLRVRRIFHTTGPAYRFYESKDKSEWDKKDDLLRKCYLGCLQKAESEELETIAFCPLSASVFRGERPLKDILCIAIDAITRACATLKHVRIISIVAYTDEELTGLINVAESCESLITDSEKDDSDKD